MKKIILLIALFICCLSSIALAATDDTSAKQTVAILPIVDNSGLEKLNEYVPDIVTARLSNKFGSNYAVLSGQALVDKLKEKGITNVTTTEEKQLMAALKESGVTFMVKTEISKVDEKRGMKWGLVIKKWCTTEMPVKTSIYDAEGKMVFEKSITELGKNEVTVGFASTAGAIKDGLKKIYDKLDQESSLMPVKQ